MTNPTGPVVVGIDGSTAALHAARWAIEEALARDVALRLVHVVDTPTPTSAPDRNGHLETQYGQTALRAADALLADTDLAVKIDTALIHGQVETVLIDESRDAAMLFVGSVGIDHLASAVLGCTALTLATQAHCPVVIVRPSDHDASTGDAWIVAVIDRGLDTETVLYHAMEAARHRHGRVLALGVWCAELGESADDELARRLATWIQRYPEVEVRLASTPSSAPPYLETFCGPIELVVMGRAEADLVPRLIGPRHPSLRPHPSCSVMVIRD